MYYSLSDSILRGLVVVHVDDLAVTGTDDFITSFASKLKKSFEISKDEPLEHFLSLSIKREDKSTASINQSHYIDDLVNQFLPENHRSVSSPTTNDFKHLVPSPPGTVPIKKPFSSLVGGLLWVAQCSRPDISFPVNRLSQFLQNPSLEHWNAAVRILQYLKQTKDLKLLLGGKSLVPVAYSDADWAEDRHDRKSTTGYVFKLGDGAISWRSRKQKTVSLSSTEAEYMVMSDSSREACWLFHLLQEINVTGDSSIKLCVDNEGAEALARNPSHHSRTKHIHTRYHFVRGCVSNGIISLQHVPSVDMLADILTKALGKILLEKHRTSLNIV